MSYPGPAGPQPALCLPWDWLYTLTAEKDKDKEKVQKKTVIRKTASVCMRSQFYIIIDTAIMGKNLTCLFKF